MERIVIQGGRGLRGTVFVSGAKNAVLKLLVSALMTEELCTFRNVPRLADVTNMMHVLRGLDAQIEMTADRTVQVQARTLGYVAPEAAVRRMRASIQIMGPLLARLGRVRVALPGGCDLGARPIDLHLKGLTALGATFVESHGYIEGRCRRLRGAEIHLDLPSVGATENIMMAAVLAEGTSVIQNAAREPEIADVAAALNAMGARIRGAGTGEIVIEGVTSLRGCDHTVVPDRIEAGTYLVAGAMAGEDVVVRAVVPQHLDAVIAKLREAGAHIQTGPDWIRVRRGSLRPIQLRTQPYPGFPTDMQPQFVSFLTHAHGTSMVTETVYTSRYKYVDELRRMGADLVVEGNVCIVRGPKRLSGTHVSAPDLRAGAALVMAGLVASGTTVVDGVEHIDRGYDGLEEKLAGLGASIRRFGQGQQRTG